MNKKKETPVQPHAQEPEKTDSEYKGLPALLHSVRWTQHLLAIVAEVLILASLAMSGMDASLGGTMAGISQFKWAWALAFALGVDTSFVISWVRVRKCVTTHNWLAFSWNIVLALGMSFIVFQPAAIQFLQQSVNISFSQALGILGINVVIMAYARAGVAVLLGAILAMTNVKSEMQDQLVDVSRKKRTFLPLQRLMDKYAPIVDTLDTQPAMLPTAQPVQSKHSEGKRPIALKAVPEPLERVRQALDTNPTLSDRQLAKMSNVSPTTAGKYRKMIEEKESTAV